MNKAEEKAHVHAELNYGGTVESPYITEVSRHSFLAGYQEGYNADRWIPADQLPDLSLVEGDGYSYSTSETFLVFDKNCGITKGVYEKGQGFAHWRIADEEDMYTLTDVTHYMTLPSPPKI